MQHRSTCSLSKLQISRVSPNHHCGKTRFGDALNVKTGGFVDVPTLSQTRMCFVHDRETDEVRMMEISKYRLLGRISLMYSPSSIHEAKFAIRVADKVFTYGSMSKITKLGQHRLSCVDDNMNAKIVFTKPEGDSVQAQERVYMICDPQAELSSTIDVIVLVIFPARKSCAVVHWSQHSQTQVFCVYVESCSRAPAYGLVVLRRDSHGRYWCSRYGSGS
jgi:hypothetical protein